MTALTVTGHPVVPASRPRVNRTTGNVYYEKRYAEWKDTAAVLLRQAQGRKRWLWEGPIAVAVAITNDGFRLHIQRPLGLLPVPASAGMLKRTVKGDADNLAKSVLDAANGVVWGDDAQIVWLSVWFEGAE